MRSDLLDRLNKWISENVPAKTVGIHESAYELRSVVGAIMRSVNEASTIYKQAMRSPTPDISAKAKGVIDEMENWSAILKSISTVKSLMNSDHPIKIMLGRPFVNALHYLERARFTEDQVEKIRQIAQHGAQTHSADFPDEINQSGMDQLLKNSIYNLSSASSKTLKVIREVLQNAVDATDPKGKPELAARQGWSPEIHIDIDTFKDGGTYLIDMTFEDKGVGMDWETLSKKFFVTFDSGKRGDTGAAGGFGIAKALIQDAPEHGWSVDTGGVHTSRFHKNVFFGSRRGDAYSPPQSEIRREKDGVTLTLHGLPFVSESQVKELCRVYATNGRVKIFVKGEEQTPKFTLDSPDIKPLSAGSLVDTVSDGDSEKEVAERILNKNKAELEEKIEDIGHVSGSRNTYRFHLKRIKEPSGGGLYVMVNGQYQFHEDKYLPKLDLILAINTTARPGDDDYPLDPGREYLRGPIKSAVDSLIGVVKKIGSMMAEDDLFKDGVESLVVNEDAKPMMIDDEESTTEKKEMMMRVFQSLTGNAFSEKGEEGEQSDEPRDGQEERERPEGEPPQASTEREQSPKRELSEEEKQEQIEAAAKQISQIVGGEAAFSLPTIVNMVKDAMGTSDSRVEYNNKLKSIIDGLTTPGHILVQKNFVARKVVSENTQLTGEMLIVWQKAIKMIIQKMTSTISKLNSARTKPFVPGLIYSDEALGLYMPARNERKFDSICLNPITLAAHLLPSLFREKLEAGDKEESAFDLIDQMEKTGKSSSSDTPTNRVSKFIFHLAIHEVCHFLHPDGYGSENFHRNISKMEVICHDEYEQIKKLVKTHMKSLRRNSEKLITLIARHRPKKVAESFRSWAEGRSKIFMEYDRPRTQKKRKELKVESFRDFLRASRHRDN